MCQRNKATIIPAVLTILSLYTRFRVIGGADFVVWDEVSSLVLHGQFNIPF
jgi:dolichyl-phosphate-mannose--protein O-mannosyl transferase